MVQVTRIDEKRFPIELAIQEYTHNCTALIDDMVRGHSKLETVPQAARAILRDYFRKG